MRLGGHRGLALGAVAALLAVLAFAVVWQRNSDDRAGQDALRRAEQLVRTSKTITPAQLTDEPFDRLVIVPGTADADRIRTAVGSDWRRADDLAYHCCMPASIWVFVDGDEVVAFFRPSLEMSYGDRVRAGSYAPSARLSL